VENTKKKLRRTLLKIRDSIPAELRKSKDRLIFEKVSELEEFRKAKTVMLFASFRTEVDTAQIIREALKNNKRVVLPRVETGIKQLKLYRIDSPEELEEGYMGIPEPPREMEREVSPGELDFILVPGVAFDEKGGRLGYGGGYYDRLINMIKTRPDIVAVAYEEQIVDNVPAERHDIMAGKIITDKRIIKCQG
jgi:5-formyltetrahydrofolate cyclo-ligase